MLLSFTLAFTLTARLSNAGRHCNAAEEHHQQERLPETIAGYATAISIDVAYFKRGNNS